MKNNILKMVLLLIVSGTCFTINAQQNLNAMIKKSESLDGVEVSVMQRKEKETKKLERVITEVKFSNNPALVNEFIAAFEKDKESAYQVGEDKKQGKIKSIYCRFYENQLDVVYSLDINDNGRVTLSKIERYE